MKNANLHTDLIGAKAKLISAPFDKVDWIGKRFTIRAAFIDGKILYLTGSARAGMITARADQFLIGR